MRRRVASPFLIRAPSEETDRSLRDDTTSMGPSQGRRVPDSGARPRTGRAPGPSRMSISRPRVRLQDEGNDNVSILHCDRDLAGDRRGVGWVYPAQTPLRINTTA